MTAPGLVPLGDLMAGRATTVNPARHTGEEFELYGIRAYDRGGPDIVRGSAIGSPKQLVQPGDVLLSRIVPHLRRAWVVGPDTGRRKLASSEWIVFRSPAVDPGYLRHLLLGDEFHASFMTTVAGVGGSLLRARPAFVAQIRVPVPPPAGQRRIAAMLSRAEALRARRREAGALLSELSGTLFPEMFGNPAGSRVRWPTVPLGALARVVRGASPRPAGDPRYFGGTIPWLRISDVTAAAGRVVGQIRGTLTEAGRAKSVYLEAGTLVLTGSATVGVPKFLGTGACVHDGFLAFPDLSGRILADYLYGYFRIMRPHLSRLAPEGTQKNLNTAIVKALEVPVPPLDLQHEFRRRTAAVQQLEAAAGRSAAALDEMAGALRQRAFRF
ncbi:restriction endonuclease subunit S [Actinoplanes sp. NPDC023801]|uniref:restriction endonuclease subunit S n=1 Tax=Actinoplanes sp. NPDC023801 TaxID=3154595 RepID=UPI0033F0CE5F